MQLMLPIFPSGTEYINDHLGIYIEGEIISYIHYGSPIFSHAKEDLRSFRYITSKFILQGLCDRKEVSDCFHVTYDSVKRYVKELERLGDKGFFTTDNRQGSCYKLLPAVKERMQQYLDEGKNNCEIARLEDVTEGSIRYAIKTGALKKKFFRRSSCR